MSSRAPKRCKIQYKFAVGIALKNSPRPLLAKEIYDFIKVHMPSICTQKNSNWENAVRNSLAISTFIEKIEEAPEDRIRAICYYKLREGGEKEFEEIFPFSYGEPYDFLTNPDHHQKLYNGEMGYPTDSEIEEARLHFEDKRWRKSIVKEEMAEKKFKATRKTRNNVLLETQRTEEEQVPTKEDPVENKENHWAPQYEQNQENLKTEFFQEYFVGAPQEQGNTNYSNTNQYALTPSNVESQAPYYQNFGVYQHNDVGPLRNNVSYTSNYQMTPYYRPDVYQVNQGYEPQQYQMCQQQWDFPAPIPQQINNSYSDDSYSLQLL